MPERLQKIIARAGITSRRSAEELITSGRVRLNGRVVTELGTQADLHKDKLEVDGKRLVPPSLLYFVFHKPRNVMSTLSDPEGRPTVAEYFRGTESRVFPVGRLDFATSGVLLVTNDGDFGNALLHPKKDVPKTYVVKVRGVMSEDDLERWRRGVELEDGKTLPAKARLIRHEEGKTWFEITIREGRNQQIRRMGDATGFFVMRLARTSFAGIDHEGLRPGEMRLLSVQELRALKETYGVPGRIPKGTPKTAPAPRPAPTPRAAPTTRGPSAPRTSPGKSSPGRPLRSERTDRSETTPRAAGPRGPRAPGRADRAGRRGRS